MILWALVAAGAAQDGAEGDLRRHLAEVLADPRYGPAAPADSRCRPVP